MHFTQKEATEAAQNYLALDPLIEDREGGGQGGARRVPLRLADRQGPAPVHHRRRRRPPRRPAAEVPAARREARAGRAAEDHLRHRHARRRRQRADPVGAVHAAVQVRRHGVRLLSNREFAQIAGRAGRKGFDDRGDVWVQAPAARRGEPAPGGEGGGEAARRRSSRRSSPSAGYAHWTQDTFDKLVGGEPEALRSHFRVNHQMVMSLLDRPVITKPTARRRRMSGRSAAADRQPRAAQAPAGSTSAGRSRSTGRWSTPRCWSSPTHPTSRVGGAGELRPAGRVRAPSAVVAVGGRGAARTAGRRGGSGYEAESDASAESRSGDAIDHALDVLTIIESVQENPGVILAAQVKRAKDELMAEMKSSRRRVRGADGAPVPGRAPEAEPRRGSTATSTSSGPGIRGWVATPSRRSRSCARCTSGR